MTEPKELQSKSGHVLAWIGRQITTILSGVTTRVLTAVVLLMVSGWLVLENKPEWLGLSPRIAPTTANVVATKYILKHREDAGSQPTKGKPYSHGILAQVELFNEADVEARDCLLGWDTGMTNLPGGIEDAFGFYPRQAFDVPAKAHRTFSLHRYTSDSESAFATSRGRYLLTIHCQNSVHQKYVPD